MPGLEVGWGVNAVALGDASRRAAALQTLRMEQCRVTGTVFLPSSAGCWVPAQDTFLQHCFPSSS